MLVFVVSLAMPTILTRKSISYSAPTRLYSPDASVISDPNPPADTFSDSPALVAEVLSRSTRRTDEGEKKDAYLTIFSLNVYLLFEQEQALVTVHRCNEMGGFCREVIQGMETMVSLQNSTSNWHSLMCTRE